MSPLPLDRAIFLICGRSKCESQPPNLLIVIPDQCLLYITKFFSVLRFSNCEAQFEYSLNQVTICQYNFFLMLIIMGFLKLHQVFCSLNLVVQDLIGVIGKAREQVSSVLNLLTTGRDHLKLVRMDKPLI